MRRALLALWAGSVAMLAIAGPAGADVFETTTLVSARVPPAVPAGHAQQADYAHAPAISGDGRFVAFDGSVGGVTGVWRRDIATGAVDPVSVGEGGTPQGSARLPSISEDGRYVSFTTLAKLVEGDRNESPDVYVRDMSLSESAPGAFTLASAINGGEESLTYLTTEPAAFGSLAAGRSAISADGRRVVFVTTTVSNLVEPHETNTPALQVAVRDLDTKQTELVSAAYDPSTGMPKVRLVNGVNQDEPVPTNDAGYGAVFPGVNRAPRFPLIPPLATVPVGASISADGSTVTWLGQEIEKQAAVLPAEPHMRPEYTEPLWRRIADGALAPTRRVTGGGDPASPACAASGERGLTQPPTLSDPCQGPFDTEPPGPEGTGTWILSPEGDYLPSLSANGLTIAFLANARLIAAGEEFGSAAQASNDLYVVDMHSGLTRVQALRRLTEIAGGKAGELATAGPIADVAVSPDGSQVMFSTQRTVFPLGSPAFVSAPAAQPGMVELFDIDLANETLTRVTQGYEGGPSEQPHLESPGGGDPYRGEQGAFSPSFSADGNTLAFASTASNLVYGDGNTPPLVEGGKVRERDGSDVFIVKRERFEGAAPPQYISPPPPSPTGERDWLLGISARSLSSGAVQLDVATPGAGAVSAGAEGAVLVRLARASTHKSRVGRGSARPKGRTKVATRLVAKAATVVSSSDALGPVTMTLVLSPSYRSLADQIGGLSAIVNVTFTAPGRPVLRQSVPVTFRRVARRSHTIRRRSSRASNRR